jgi:single-stranded-DNA-specific exonuclease
MRVLQESSRHFLGVDRSATGRVWRDRLDDRGNARSLAIAQRHGVPDLLARILAGRNVEVDSVDAYLDPTIKRLMPDPQVIVGMEAAANRIADAVVRGELVAIFGDYDVDGATSSALLASFLRMAGVEPLIHIPDRIFEGYGPNVDAIQSLAARGAKLLVTVDCGTTSMEPLAEAKRLGLDTIVIDHHQADESLPAAVAVVNPNRLDDLSGLGQLAAVGLTFLTVVAVNRALRQRGFWRPSVPSPVSAFSSVPTPACGGGSGRGPEPDLLALLDLVALGTVADVVPLKGLNRAFVAKGLIAMRRRQRVGLTALMDVSRLTGPPEPWHLGFLLGPRINAGGRIGRADLGAQLLLCADPPEAAAMAAQLDTLNRERQLIEMAAVEEAQAEAMAALGVEEKGAVVVTASPGWHPGVVGLVAARIKERFGRPAFAIALRAGDVGTGSGRSIAGVDLGRAVRQAVAEGLLIKGGGHAMAAGVTLKRGALGEFRAFLEQHLAADVETSRRDDALLVDGALTARAATAELHAILAAAGPFGAGNPEPVIALPAHTVAHAEEVGQARAGHGHVRARLRSGDGATINAIAFRAAGQKLGAALMESRGRTVHVAGTLSMDRWQGTERIQLRMIDVAAADPVERMRM